jgi:ribonuclease-3
VSDDPEDDAVNTVLERLDYRFSDKALLSEALTHRSFANEHDMKGQDNQRLEFLGDAVLGLVVAELLMERALDAREGQLTPRRAALVKEESLARVARQMKLGEALRLGRGEEKNMGRDRPSMLADAVEAVLGAVHLDGGYEASKRAVISLFGSRIDDVAVSESPRDPKNVIQERLQSIGDDLPQYRVVAEEGPDHDKVFEVALEVDAKVIAVGRGRSKKEAEMNAAAEALAEMEKK